MNKQTLLLVPMVALLVMVPMVASSGAQDDPGMSFAAPAMQGAAAQSPSSSGQLTGRRHHGPSLKAIMEKLGITDEQKTKIRALYVGFKDRTRKAHMELRSLKDEKKTMLLSGKVDQQKLAQMDDQIVKLVSSVLPERLKLRRDRLALLTPEQIGRIADWQAEKAFRSKWRRMHGGWMHHRGW
ncbi:MAG: Spy/CpxP family protein refolding chaperone [Desulfomonilaceae bacterium]